MYDHTDCFLIIRIENTAISFFFPQWRTDFGIWDGVEEMLLVRLASATTGNCYTQVLQRKMDISN